MNARFKHLTRSLQPKLKALLGMPGVKFVSLPKAMPRRAVYLFSQGRRHLYVGRTNRLRQRLQNHCRPSGDHYTATFAFLIARRQTGRRRASYSKRESRAALLRSPEFARAFNRAKSRVAKMNIRYVEERDPVRQALLEIYVATSLRTSYNDFETH